MDISARSLKIKREIITKLLDEDLYPYTKRYLGTFANHFSTIGLVGMNEVGLNANWLRKDLTHKETQEFSKQVLNYMREKLSDYQEKYGDLYNLEATPAESTSYRLAKHDVRRYPLMQQTAVHLIILTLHIFLLVIQTTSLQRLIFRTNCRLSIPQVLYSMHSLVRSFLHGNLLLLLSERLLKTINFRIILFHLRILYVRTTVILQARYIHALLVVKQPRFTAVSQAITDL